jgi:mono/diheme cytochrome c family protein
MNNRQRLPIWIVAISGALFFWSQAYLSKNAGGFDPNVYAPYRSSNELAKAQPPFDPNVLIEQGRMVFARSCSQCHQYSGMGDPSKAPPLVGAEWLLGAGPNRIGRILLDGFTGPVNIKGKIWNLNMPSWKEQLKDDEIAAVLSYVRNEWGNHAPVIRPEQIARIRELEKERSTPWTFDELEHIPQN